jgi:lipopolysaccharide biosynthesis protein
LKSICFFSSYFNHEIVPYYIRYYLLELTKHFTEVVLLTNKKNLIDSFLQQNNIWVRQYTNEGMDFGMWYRAFNEFDLSTYDRVGLINDSCILFKSLKPVFEKANSSSADTFGFVLSGKFSSHLQSYFILLNKRAILPAKEFFLSKGIIEGYMKIIFQYEIGLSKYLLEKGLRFDAFYNYSHNTLQNPSYILSKELIEKGSPLIKKKLINRNFTWGDYLSWMRNDIDINHHQYIQCILLNNLKEELIDFNKVADELGTEKRKLDLFLYRTAYFFYKKLKGIGLLRSVFHGLIKTKRLLTNER